jgi:hypothetical protein
VNILVAAQKSTRIGQAFVNCFDDPRTFFPWLADPAEARTCRVGQVGASQPRIPGISPAKIPASLRSTCSGPTCPNRRADFQTTKTEALQVGEPHLDALTLAARLLEGFGAYPRPRDVLISMRIISTGSIEGRPIVE